ncbi:MAG: M23 family metallopeptidase [Gammaproteobacteria bacterium]|nr:M23 family metallopeptidase [Gammaproteobacteria bacterium]
MNIIIFSKSGARSRQINSPVQFLLLGFLFLSLLITPLYWGYQLGVHQNSNEMPELNYADIRQQRESQEQLQQAKSEVTALTRHLGQLQAYMTRLDALGARLVKVAKLDDQEFDFSQVPPLGGPVSDAQIAEYTLSDLGRMAQTLQVQMQLREEKLSILESVLFERRLRNEILPAGRPIKKGWMSSAYGIRTDPFSGKPQMHKGIDFAGKMGSSIYAVASGVVSWAGKRHGYGQLVEIQHGNGYSTRYAHGAKVLVQKGDLVSQGQEVAKMGSSGRSTGPHLHFELLKKGRQINPVKFVRSRRKSD